TPRRLRLQPKASFRLQASWGGPTYFDWTTGGLAGNYGGTQGLMQVPDSWWTSGVSQQDQPLIYGGNGYVVEFYNSPNSPSPTPEPTTMLLFGTGIAGLVGSRVGRRQK
ncbi:MAG: PEP-CTERM sorting domain-containing protein, partial [Desulfobacteraceae bacterium]|nr:PEP-CTERM sorting domain-containing protein [Desulfobacteraceae bacterium]